MSVEKLLLDYAKANIPYIDDDTLIEDITTAGDQVIFKTRDNTDDPYPEQQMIPLLDIMAWMYGK